MFKHVLEFEGNIKGSFFTDGPLTEADVRKAEKEVGRGSRRHWLSEKVEKKEFEGVRMEDAPFMNTSENIKEFEGEVKQVGAKPVAAPAPSADKKEEKAPVKK